MMLPVVILSGGFGKRLGTITNEYPKSLVLINGKPFLYWQLKMLRKQGLKEVIVCTGFQSHMIENYIKKIGGLGLNIKVSEDGDRPLGTGGAIKKAILRYGLEKFFVLYGDSYLRVDYSKFEKFFTISHSNVAMTIYHNRGNFDKSNVSFLSGNKIIYNKKKPSTEMSYIDYGLSIINSNILLDRTEEEFDLAEVIEDQSSMSQVVGYEVLDRFFEIGSRTGVEEFEKWIINQ